MIVGLERHLLVVLRTKPSIGAWHDLIARMEQAERMTQLVHERRRLLLVGPTDDVIGSTSCVIWSLVSYPGTQGDCQSSAPQPYATRANRLLSEPRAGSCAKFERVGEQDRLAGGGR